MQYHQILNLQKDGAKDIFRGESGLTDPLSCFMKHWGW